MNLKPVRRSYKSEGGVLCARRKRVLTKTLLIMKLSAILLLAFTLQVSANGYAQKVTLSVKETSLEKVFKEIEKQTGYYFAYTSELLKTSKPISIDVKDATLKDVLDQCIKDQSLTYTITEKVISVKMATPSNFFLNLPKPPIEVKGRIVNENGQPVIATVFVKGTGNAVTTDANGFFILKDVEENATLVITAVNIETREMKVNSKPDLAVISVKTKVTLGADIVINTGYQKQRINEITGSVTHIDNELFNRKVGATVLDRINDLVPGLLKHGAGGNALNGYTLRGTGTLNASSAPLLILDNFIFDGDPNSINPNDVENITILKDAASSSIWGARAGNGVIVITTKKGKINSRPIVSVNTNIIIGEKPNLFSIPSVNSSDVISLERKRFAGGYYDGGLGVSYPALSPIVEILALERVGSINLSEANRQIELYEQHDIRDDIKKYLLQTAMATQVALNISGGTPNYQYYGSIGYDRNRPNDINVSNDRITLSYNNTWKPVKGLQINSVLNWGQATQINNNNLGGYGSILSSPYQMLADNSGGALPIPLLYRLGYVDTVNFPGKLDWRYRPLDEAKNGNRDTKIYNTRISGSINYSLLKYLDIEVSYNWQKSMAQQIDIKDIKTFETRDLINRYSQTGSNGLAFFPIPMGGIYKSNHNDQTSSAYRIGINFDRSIGLHNIKSLVGFERSESKSNQIILSPQYGYNQETNIFGVPQFGSWIIRPTGNSEIIGPIPATLNGSLSRFGSCYGNIAYSYNRKLIFSASGRIDESNFYGVHVNDRKVPLWSIGTKWDISSEPFYKSKLIAKIAIRATYGYNGNTNAGMSPHATIGYRNPISPVFVPFASITTPPNPTLGWEQVRTIDIGIDFSSQKNRVFGTVDFYQKKATDLISPITLDPTSGFSLYTGNSSSIQVSGIDFSLNTLNIDKTFKWYSNLNFAFQKDKVLTYSVEPPQAGRTTGIFIGKPLQSIFSYNWAGLNPSSGDAQFYLGGQVVGSSALSIGSGPSQEDMVYSGQTNPPVFGSFRNTFKFHSITLSINIAYQFGHHFRRASFTGFFGNSLWQHEDYLKAWKVSGDEVTTNVPGFKDVYPDQRYDVYAASNILIERADHLSLEDIRFEYGLSKKWIHSFPFRNASLYVCANNLGFIWKASNYNPDTEGQLLPTKSKSFAFGLNVTF